MYINIVRRNVEWWAAMYDTKPMWWCVLQSDGYGKCVSHHIEASYWIITNNRSDNGCLIVCDVNSKWKINCQILDNWPQRLQWPAIVPKLIFLEWLNLFTSSFSIMLRSRGDREMFVFTNLTNVSYPCTWEALYSKHLLPSHSDE